MKTTKTTTQKAMALILALTFGLQPVSAMAADRPNFNPRGGAMPETPAGGTRPEHSGQILPNTTFDSPLTRVTTSSADDLSVSNLRVTNIGEDKAAVVFSVDNPDPNASFFIDYKKCDNNVCDGSWTNYNTQHATNYGMNYADLSNLMSGSVYKIRIRATNGTSVVRTAEHDSNGNVMTFKTTGVTDSRPDPMPVVEQPKGIIFTNLFNAEVTETSMSANFEVNEETRVRTDLIFEIDMRVKGATAWDKATGVIRPVALSSLLDVDGLIPDTEYEFQVRVLDLNGVLLKTSNVFGGKTKSFEVGILPFIPEPVDVPSNLDNTGNEELQLFSVPETSTSDDSMVEEEVETFSVETISRVSESKPQALSIAPAESLEISLGLMLDGNGYLNWGGKNEKWYKGNDGKSYYITPDGNIYRWNGSNNLSNDELVQPTTPITPAVVPVVSTPAVSTPQSVVSIESLGLALDGNGYLNWGGKNEKWYKGNDGKSYYITPDGKIYRWNGSNNLSNDVWVNQPSAAPAVVPVVSTPIVQEPVKVEPPVTTIPAEVVPAISTTDSNQTVSQPETKYASNNLDQMPAELQFLRERFEKENQTFWLFEDRPKSWSVGEFGLPAELEPLAELYKENPEAIFHGNKIKDIIYYANVYNADYNPPILTDGSELDLNFDQPTGSLKVFSAAAASSTSIALHWIGPYAEYTPFKVYVREGSKNGPLQTYYDYEIQPGYQISIPYLKPETNYWVDIEWTDKDGKIHLEHIRSTYPVDSEYIRTPKTLVPSELAGTTYSPIGKSLAFVFFDEIVTPGDVLIAWVEKRPSDLSWAEKSAPSKLKFQFKKEGEDWQNAFSSGGFVSLNNLDANATYYYRVIDRDGVLHTEPGSKCESESAVYGGGYACGSFKPVPDGAPIYKGVFPPPHLTLWAEQK